MQELLTAIKTRLKTDIMYIRDIYITEDENLIPESIKFPAIGIKDGPILRKELPGEVMEEKMTVRIIPLVQLQKPEAAVMGDGSTSNKGVLAVSKDIHSSLDMNRLGITGMQYPFSSSETESETVGDERDAMQRKIITYEYVKERGRP